jgi:hypothetical protein
MKLLAGIVALWALGAPAPAFAEKPEARLGRLAGEVLDADYRGDRAALARLEGELADLKAGPLSEYRDYWRGFARWRRAINGFNETPAPDDLASDLEAAVERFRAALEKRPDWIEARLAMAGCWGNLLYVAGKDEAKRKTILEQAVPDIRWVMENAGENPRALWIKGGYELYQASAPPPKGGDYEKAVATLRHGVECAWREAMSAPKREAWEPGWGGPENLMDLAYLYSHSPQPDRRAALAYAQGALVSVPSWHYVRDVLLPQIEGLSVPPAP